MSEYRETTITGKKRQRAYRVVISNELNQQPTIEFQEEEVLDLDGTQIRQTCGGIVLPFDPGKEVPLIDPRTNMPILDEKGVQRTTTMLEAYVLIYSSYWQAAAERDNQTKE